MIINIIIIVMLLIHTNNKNINFATFLIIRIDFYKIATKGQKSKN